MYQIAQSKYCRKRYDTQTHSKKRPATVWNIYALGGTKILSYKPITNTAWVRARLCRLQKMVHSTRSQLLAHGRWFSPGTPASSTTKLVAMI
jgi:hypothetical protein